MFDSLIKIKIYIKINCQRYVCINKSPSCFLNNSFLFGCKVITSLNILVKFNPAELYLSELSPPPGIYVLLAYSYKIALGIKYVSNEKHPSYKSCTSRVILGRASEGNDINKFI